MVADPGAVGTGLLDLRCEQSLARLEVGEVLPGVEPEDDHPQLPLAPEQIALVGLDKAVAGNGAPTRSFVGAEPAAQVAGQRVLACQPRRRVRVPEVRHPLPSRSRRHRSHGSRPNDTSKEMSASGCRS